jgi:hypothetical protein
MAVVPATYTSFLKFPIPGEDSDPFYDQFVELIRAIESRVFMNDLIKNFFLTKGGTLTWNSGTGIFTWTEDFEVPVFFYGKKMFLRYGPDAATRALALQDGQAIIVEIPSVIGTDTVLNLNVVSQLDVNKANQWVIAFRNGSNLHIHTLGTM